MTKTFFSLVIQEKSVLQPSLIPLPTESYLPIKNTYVKLEKHLRKVQVRLIWSSKEAYLKSKRDSLKVGKSLTRWQPGRSGNCIATYLTVRRDITVITSGRIKCYIGT